MLMHKTQKDAGFGIYNLPKIKQNHLIRVQTSHKGPREQF